MQPVFTPRHQAHFASAGRRETLPYGYFALHASLGFLLSLRPQGMELLPLGLAFVCFYQATLGRPEALLSCLLYVSCSEVLLRILGIAPVYEFGKYLVCLLALIWSIRLRAWRTAGLPLLYFALLLPSILVANDPTRRELSFNLSGPLTLALSAMVFSALHLDSSSLFRALSRALGPVLVTWAICFTSTIRAENLVFNESVFETSAGFGPNQVSTIFGLGTLFGLFLLLHSSSQRGRLLYGSLIALFLGQGILTFSRGGVWTAVASCALLLWSSRKELLVRKVLRRLLPFFFLLAAAGIAVDRFTQNAWRDRYSDFQSTGRTTLAQMEWHAFKTHPLLGLGPGGAKEFREQFDMGIASHTEYTRLLAEHGSLGLLAFFTLAAMAAGRLMGDSHPLSKNWAQICFLWSGLTMLHGGMRLAATGMAFGLAMVVLRFKKP